MARDYVPILMLMAAAVGIAAVILETYESGVPLLDVSHKRLSIKFFVIAIVFILFDVEIAFLYPWAVIFRSGGPGLFLEMLVFLAILAVGYAYIWRKGAFDL